MKKFVCLFVLLVVFCVWALTTSGCCGLKDTRLHLYDHLKQPIFRYQSGSSMQAWYSNKNIRDDSCQLVRFIPQCETKNQTDGLKRVT